MIRAARFLITGISAATGTCFAVLAGLSLSALALPARRFHVASAVIAAVAICLGYIAFRAATASKTDEEIVLTSLRRGMVGALTGLVVIIAFLLMFGPDAHGFLAHALGKHASDFTTSRLLTAAVLLGFGTGFVIRMPKNLADASPESNKRT